MKKTPEASNPNSHSYVCGNQNWTSSNTGGVEYNEGYLMDLTYSTPSGVDKSINSSTTDATVAIGIKCLRH
jgi:hypothetical protein